MYFNPAVSDGSNGTVLIMCTDHGTCQQLREYLQTKNAPKDGDDTIEGDSQPKTSARLMMRRKLRNYLGWKRDFARVSASLFSEHQKSINGSTDNYKGANTKGKPPPNKRRRVRGGTGGAGTNKSANGTVNVAGDRDAHIADLLAELQPTEAEALQKGEIATDPLDDMEAYFELFDLSDIVVIHPYDEDLDEHILEELKPRYVIMYEPDAAFIRRVEVYRSSHVGRNIRVYFMYYGGSVEEQRYLSAVRREKDAFTRLIRERGVCSPRPSCKFLAC